MKRKKLLLVQTGETKREFGVARNPNYDVKQGRLEQRAKLSSKRRWRLRTHCEAQNSVDPQKISHMPAGDLHWD